MVKGQESKKGARKVSIYTDGACIGNPGPGGWGAVIQCDSGIKQIFGSEKNITTNNRMEITAVIEALNSLEDNCLIESLKYKTRNEFQKNSPTAYDLSLKNGWSNKMCSHMIKIYGNYSNKRKPLTRQ